MKLYQFIISILCLRFMSIKMYLIFINSIFMIEFYHSHRFINYKPYEKYFNKIKVNANNSLCLLEKFSFFKYFTTFYNFVDKYWTIFKDDFTLMVYEKFVSNFIENNKEKKQKKFNEFLSSFSSTLRNIERQTETNNQYFIQPINPFDDKTRIDDE